MEVGNVFVGTRYELHFEKSFLVVKDIQNRKYLKVSGEIMQLIHRNIGSNDLEKILEKMFELKTFPKDKKLVQLNFEERKRIGSVVHKIPNVVCQLNTIMLVVLMGLIIGGLDIMYGNRNGKCSYGTWLLWTILNIFMHEIGHVSLCIHSGRTVPSIGLKLNYGIPMFYVDTTDICMCSLNSKIAVSLGGVYANACLCIVISIIDLLGSKLGLVELSSISFFFVISNLIPFIKLDGYYALSDYIGEANLNRASEYAFRRLMKRKESNKKNVLLSVFFIGKSLFLLFVMHEIIRSILGFVYSWL